MTELGVDGSDISPSAVTTEDLVIEREFNPARTESLYFADTPAPPASHWSSTTTGSGFATSSGIGVLMFGTGGTQDSVGEQWYEPGGDGNATIPSEITDWSKDRTWRAYVSVTDVGELIRFGMGLLRDSDQWIGFEFDGGVLNAISNDGSTENKTQIDASPTATAYDFRMEFVSGTRVEYYVNGTKQTEHTSNLPSGGSRSGFLYAGRAENPNSATDAQASYSATEVVIHA